MKIRGMHDGIPGWWLDDPASPDGHRFVASVYGWQQLRLRVRGEANNRCEECRAVTYHGDLHHVIGRAGGKRDDRRMLNGKLMLLWLCRDCHSETKIERRPPKYPVKTIVPSQVPAE